MGGTSADVGVIAGGRVRPGSVSSSSGACRSRCRRRPHDHRCGRRLDRRHRPRRAAARSGRRAPAPSPARRPTARAAPTPPSRTRTSCSAGSTPSTSWAARLSWTRDLARRAVEPVGERLGLAGGRRAGDRRAGDGEHGQRGASAGGRSRAGLPRASGWSRSAAPARCTRRDGPPRRPDEGRDPAHPGLGSAFGALAADLRVDRHLNAHAAIRLRHRRGPAGRPAHRRRAGAGGPAARGRDPPAGGRR